MVVGLKKQVAIFVEGPGDSQVDSAAASQDGFIKQKIMETIFDHNVTPEEVENITGFNLSKERYLKHYKTQIDCYTSIYYLYK